MLLELLLGFYLGVFISLVFLASFVCLLKYCDYLDEAKELEVTLWFSINIFVASVVIAVFIILFI